ncbi:hypothetical protein KIN34_07570 [Cellulomonas sp. DKR-3]|uniref:Trehalose 2-sulfotransferase n=1 Tax=Cellulomonas fulva TaxID=2835530 RepID=A0ABS5TYB1_9CELL|nr:Stf0 family sulfotransferase [Cellulomonas fulva]MBT0994142.1 hypothetical protein [Cellulomonas fulva]
MTSDGTDAARARPWNQFGAQYDHPPFVGTPRTYLIASVPRSGSHMLGHLLHATGVLGSPLEYLQLKNLTAWQRRLGTADAASTLRGIMARRTSPSGWFGVKSHWRQLAPVLADPALTDVLDVREWVRITRTDTVAQAVSLLIASQTNAWISFQDATREPTYDFDAIAERVRLLQEEDAGWDAFFASRDLDPLVVVYEDLIADPAAAVAAVCTRLDVPVPEHLPEAGTARQATDLNERWRERFLSESVH